MKSFSNWQKISFLQLISQLVDQSLFLVRIKWTKIIRCKAILKKMCTNNPNAFWNSSQIIPHTHTRNRFDSTNLFEYLFIVIGQYIAAVFEFIYFGNMTTFAIAAFLLFLATINDIHENLKFIDECAESKRKYLEISKQLTGFIRRHSVLQELSVNKVFLVVFSWIFKS